MKNNELCSLDHSQWNRNRVLTHLLRVVNVLVIIIDLFCFVLFCWVICFQSQNETSKLFPEVASILAAYLRNTHLRDPYHPSPATITARDQFTREVGGVFKE